jgi:beta-xylosidase
MDTGESSRSKTRAATAGAPGAATPQSPAPASNPARQRKPLVSHIFTADPSAHVFEDQIYIYPSHDIDSGVAESDDGAHFDMVDYHVLSMRDIDGPVVDHGPVLHVRDVPWAEKQMWAPDAAERGGTYYLFFPAKDPQGIFRIGVATSKSPAGPFEARPQPIAGSYSIDPAVFIDDDGQAYMYFGGLWGGQLERWQSGSYDPDAPPPALDGPALMPRVARLDADLGAFVDGVHEVAIVDAAGAPLKARDTEQRFFEAAWMHKYKGVYYLSYSTGDTHLLVYATSRNPLGPFVFGGRILNPVLGWTTHHSIVEFRGSWYLFYHDSSLSNGVTHKRCVKVTELQHEPDGSIRTIDPYP